MLLSSHYVVRMPYQILCNGTFQKSHEAMSGLGLASPHRTSLHTNRYGVLADPYRLVSLQDDLP